MLHGIISIVVVGVVLVYQWIFRRRIIKNLREYSNIFDGIQGKLGIVKGTISTQEQQEAIENINNQITQLRRLLIGCEDEEYKNIYTDQLQDYMRARKDLQNQISVGGETFRLIIANLNNYLRKNVNSVADYHLMKDIVDRNCDVKEEEISTQLPFPLYAGLVGTMIGIIIGVISLAWGLGDEINVDSISPLLLCVGLAMVASACGIMITTQCSNKYKEAQKILAKDKDEFLSWIQAELLPNVGTDFPSAISKMAGNLNEFNSTFSTNVKELRSTLTTVNDSYAMQAAVLDRIKGWRIDRIATANAEIYDKLKNSTEEIGGLVNHLQSLGVHFNQQYDNAQRMAVLLNNWESEIETRKANVSKAVSQVDDTLKTSLHNLQEATDGLIKDMQVTFTKQVDALQSQTNALPQLVKELDNLTSIKTSLQELKHATEAQTSKMNYLMEAIRELAQRSQSEGTVIVVNPFKEMWNGWAKWKRWLCLGCVSLIPLCCLTYLIYLISLLKIVA